MNKNFILSNITSLRRSLTKTNGHWLHRIVVLKTLKFLFTFTKPCNY